MTVSLPMMILAGKLLAGVSADAEFEQLADRYVDQFPALAPVSATYLGDHRYDGELDQITAAARQQAADFYRKYLDQLDEIDRSQLSRANQVDALLLENELNSSLWSMTELQEWAWNPTRYTGLAGGAIYGLVSREFAPLEQRLLNVADRLEEFPRLFKQIRATLEPDRVPKVHAETAIKQNRGVLSILDNSVRPVLDTLDDQQRERLEQAMETATAAVEKHQSWLESDLLPNAKGNFRIGAEHFDRKLAYTLQSSMDREAIGKRAWSELDRARQEMYGVSKTIYLQQYPQTRFPEHPNEAYRQAITRAALEVVYLERPQRGEIVDSARRFLAQVTEFVKQNQIVTVPDDPVEIIVMPEFRRGIALAYCDSPGPLDVGQKTFYAVSPLPADWTTEQDESFLREYNNMGVQVLTIHEATPGHFMQIARANRYPSTLRAVLSSGSFIEGWAVYTEGVMQRQGYLDHDPRFHLIVLKLYVRAIVNAIIDQEIHAGDMNRDQAMALMVEKGFQEEREAAGKWVRAQLSSTQLSTYLVGFLEHTDLRAETEQAWGDDFSLKHYHDTELSFGSPPVHYARALLLDLPIERP
jgi:uncharacterized protein (DUF885 family)